MISIITPTYNRTRLLVDRAMPSVLAQSCTDWEWVVVGDGTEQATVDAMAAVTDPRIRFTNLSRHEYPDDPQARWCALGAAPTAWGIEQARGEWVTVLADDDELMAEHLATLLSLAEESGADCVYGRAEVVGHGLLGSWPPRPSGFVYSMWRRSTGFTLDPESWRRGVVCDWDMWNRMLTAGIPWAFTPAVLYRYFPANKVPVVDAA
ncbi:MAG: glycosyltransferase [Elusimicrobia bacterium]|nr:glycosyltransferase [Elusimicrobiota bacterium]